MNILRQHSDKLPANFPYELFTASIDHRSGFKHGAIKQLQELTGYQRTKLLQLREAELSGKLPEELEQLWYKVYKNRRRCNRSANELSLRQAVVLWEQIVTARSQRGATQLSQCYTKQIVPAAAVIESLNLAIVADTAQHYEAALQQVLQLREDIARVYTAQRMHLRYHHEVALLLFGKVTYAVLAAAKKHSIQILQIDDLSQTAVEAAAAKHQLHTRYDADWHLFDLCTTYRSPEQEREISQLFAERGIDSTNHKLCYEEQRRIKLELDNVRHPFDLHYINSVQEAANVL